MWRPRRPHVELRAVLLGCLFLSLLVCAVLVHLDTRVARRTLERWGSSYLSSELRGTFDIGRIEKLTTSCIWLKDVVIYDEQQRRVATLDRVQAHSTLAGAVFRWLTKKEALTFVIESVRADGVHLRMHPDPIDQQPSLLVALEPDPNSSSRSPDSPLAPYRVFLPNVEIGDVRVDSALPSFVTTSARLRQLSGQLLFTNQGIAASLKRFSLDLSDPVSVPLHAFGTLEYRSPDRIWGDVNATLGEIPFSAHLQYQKETLELAVDAFRVAPSAMRQWFPNWPLLQPLTASLRTHGPVRELGVRLDLEAGASRIETVGTLAMGQSPSADLAIEGRSLDLRALFGPPLPSDFDAAARVTVTVEDGQPHMHFDGVVHPGRIGQIATPRVDVQGQFDSEGLILSGRSSDTNLPIRAAAVLRNQELSIDAQLDAVQLARLVPTSWQSNSRGVVSVRARAKITGELIASTVDVTARDVRIGSTSMARANMTASIEGPLETPLTWSGEANLSAQGLSSPYLRFDRVSARASGNAQKAHLALIAEQPGIAKVAFDSDVLPLKGPAIKSGQLQLTRGASSFSLRAESLVLTDDAILLDGLVLDGSAGHAAGSFGVQHGHVFGKLEGQSLDLTAVSDLIGLPPRFLSGGANIVIDVDTRQQPAAGHARFDFESATMGLLTNLSGNVELRLNGNQLVGESVIGSELIDDIRASIDVALAGPPIELASYRRAAGTAALDLSGIRLDRVGSLLGLLKRGLGMAGTANVRLSVERAGEAGPPNLMLSAATHQLALSIPHPAGSVQLRDMDLFFSVGFRGATDTLQSDWVLSRNSQPKATLSLTTAMPPIDDWIAYPTLVLAHWRELPFEVFLTLPKQSLAELSSILDTPIGTGDAELKIWLKGPVGDAHLVTEIHGSNLLLEQFGNSVPFDTQGLAEYTQNTGEARVLLAAGSNQTTWIQLNGIGSIVPCARGFGCVSEWDGRIEAGLLGLPIAALPYLTGLGFTGDVRGVLSARRESGITSIDGVLPIDNFRMSGVPLGQALIHIRSDINDLVAGAKLIDGGAQIDFEAYVPTQWRSLLPHRRNDAAIRLAASAKGYDASIARPWLDNYVTGLGGELSGSIDATYGTTDGTNGDQTSTPRLALSGYVTLTRGKAVIRELGLSLNDVSIAAQASSTGTRTTISVPTVSASVGDGQNNLNGSVVAELEALSLKRVTGRIGRAKEVPLIANSVTIATLTSTANFEITPQPAGFDVDIEFDDLDVGLPRASARKIVGLAENPDIIVLQPLGTKAWREARTAHGSEYRIRLALGNKARVTRTDFTLPITGTPEVVIGNRVRPSGTVQLEPMGRLQLFGKSFVVDRGRVTFDPEQPGNPQLDVTATWRGPTHLVTVQVQGKLEEARLRLSSDPPLASETQVMALLLGGSSGSDSTASAGLGVGATLFNEFLSDTALSSLEVRTSSDERRANYTAAVPIRENLWFEATYQSPNNTNLPGSSAQRGFSGTVDYRFRRNWSVRTEVGTLGAGADLLWQYRY